MSIEFAPNIHQADTDELANLCKALGHPARKKILQHLLTEDSCILDMDVNGKT